MSAHSLPTPPLDSDSQVRKRVCKACDRCRLKKSKCDGSIPCLRCRSDNAICVFGERKKSHDKVYPKGYVEMLEQQQTQLVEGLQELYRRLVAAGAWTGPLLVGSNNGHPLTHDILQAVGAFNHDSSSEFDDFEDNLNTMQQRLLSSRSIPMRRRGSGDSDSEHESIQNSFVESPKSAQSAHFTTHRFPPTPPLISPCLEVPKEQPPELKPRPQPMCLQTSTLRHPQTSMNPAALQRQTWAQCPLPYDTSMDFLQHEPPLELQFPESLLGQPAGSSMPLVDMWTEDDFQSFMDTSMV